jgi:carbonic anhydrase/acetyltransferase-like protein (isoleucine patch superfamily)
VPEGKVLESGYLYLGSPAKKIRPLKETEIAYFMYSAEQYIALNQDFLREN